MSDGHKAPRGAVEANILTIAKVLEIDPLEVAEKILAWLETGRPPEALFAELSHMAEMKGNRLHFVDLTANGHMPIFIPEGSSGN